VSPRTRELGFLVPGALLGVIGVASVASAKSNVLEPGPVAVAAAVIGLFLAMHAVLRLRMPEADPYLLPIVGAITAIGLVTLQRIDPALARNQVIWVAVGAIGFIAVVLIVPDHHVLERYRYMIGLTGVGLLVITMIFGTEINGARLWIEIGGGQTVQLGEFSKVLIVIFLAGFLRDKRELLAVPTRKTLGIPVPPAAVVGPLVLFLVAALALVAVLNDFGTALLFFGIFLAMIYIAAGRAAYAISGFVLFLVGSVAVWALVPRVADRVTNWLDPFSDEQKQGYQLVQSLYALADGGTFGPGLGRGFLVLENGRRVVPALETDFLFTAIGAEMGFIGAVGVLLLFVVLAARGFAIAARAPDGFSKLLAAGLTTVVGLQALLIVGGVVRLVPLTGVTLPFMSYGGSSVVTNFALIALLLVVSHRTERPYRPRVRRREREAERSLLDPAPSEAYGE
jgi:cell division protein FtsW (lipid II flippase)